VADAKATGSRRASALVPPTARKYPGKTTFAPRKHRMATRWPKLCGDAGFDCDANRYSFSSRVSTTMT